MTLDRILQSQGFGTRRYCGDLIGAGLVEVNGELCEDPRAQFEVDGLQLTVDGEAWVACTKAYLMLNKPAGYECSREPQHHLSVFALLPAPLVARGVQCVGRLDEDTTGLLLLSDDGQFVHAYTSPKRKVPKTYLATTRHALDEAQLAALRAGVLLHGERQPLAAAAVHASGERCLELTINEGKYHQVKRMIAAAGNRCEALHRQRIGGLALPDALEPGAWQWLGEHELGALAGH